MTSLRSGSVILSPVKSKSLDLRIIISVFVVVISSLGAIPVGVAMSGTSLSALLTVFQFLLFLSVTPFLRIRKKNLVILFSYITFIAISAAWTFALGATIENYQRLILWFGSFMITVVLSSYLGSLTSVYLWQRMSFILSLIRLGALLYMLSSFFLLLMGRSDPATPMISMFYFSYYLFSPSIDATYPKYRYVNCLLLILIPILFQSRIVMVANIVIVGYYLVNRFGYRGAMYFLTFVAISTFGIITYNPQLIGLNEGDLAFTLMGVSINTSGRINAWGLMVESIMNSPLLGHGTDIAPKMEGVAGWIHPHNDYLRIAHRVGFIGFTLLLMFYGSVISSISRAKSHSHSSVEVSIFNFVLSSTLGVAVCMLTDNIVVYSYAMYLFSMILGLGWGVAMNKG